jgi:hypothetical protein
MEQSSGRLNDANSFLACSMVTYIAIFLQFLILFYFFAPFYFSFIYSYLSDFRCLPELTGTFFLQLEDET